MLFLITEPVGVCVQARAAMAQFHRRQKKHQVQEAALGARFIGF